MGNVLKQWCPTFFPFGLDGWCSECLQTRSGPKLAACQRRGVRPRPSPATLGKHGVFSTHARLGNSAAGERWQYYFVTAPLLLSFLTCRESCRPDAMASVAHRLEFEHLCCKGLKEGKQHIFLKS